jgi:hypothetical protein
MNVDELANLADKYPERLARAYKRAIAGLKEIRQFDTGTGGYIEDVLVPEALTDCEKILKGEG